MYPPMEFDHGAIPFPLSLCPVGIRGTTYLVCFLSHWDQDSNHVVTLVGPSSHNHQAIRGGPISVLFTLSQSFLLYYLSSMHFSVSLFFCLASLCSRKYLSFHDVYLVVVGQEEMNDSHVGVILTSRGYLAVSTDSLAVVSRRGTTGIIFRDAAEHPSVHKMVLQQRLILALSQQCPG